MEEAGGGGGGVDVVHVGSRGPSRWYSMFTCDGGSRAGEATLQGAGTALTKIKSSYTPYSELE